MISDIMMFRNILAALTWRNIKVRYKQTLMGFLWAIFMPCAILISGIFMRIAASTITGIPLDKSEVLTIAIKAVPWAFYVGAMKIALVSVTANINLVTKVYFPRIILPLSGIATQLFDTAIASISLAVILALYGVGIGHSIIWLPLIIAILLVLTAGLSIIFSCANVFYRDVKFLVDVVLTYAVFVTPVFYNSDTLGRWKGLIMMNPVSPLIEATSDIIVHNISPDPLGLIYSASWSVALFALSIYIFNRSEPLFAEKI